MKKSKKIIHIVVFMLILGFLLFLIPPVNQALRTQFLEFPQLFVEIPLTTTNTVGSETLGTVAISDTTLEGAAFTETGTRFSTTNTEFQIIPDNLTTTSTTTGAMPGTGTTSTTSFGIAQNDVALFPSATETTSDGILCEIDADCPGRCSPDGLSILLGSCVKGICADKICPTTPEQYYCAQGRRPRSDEEEELDVTFFGDEAKVKGYHNDQPAACVAGSKFLEGEHGQLSIYDDEYNLLDSFDLNTEEGYDDFKTLIVALLDQLAEERGTTDFGPNDAMSFLQEALNLPSPLTPEVNDIMADCIIEYRDTNTSVLNDLETTTTFTGTDGGTVIADSGGAINISGGPDLITFSDPGTVDIGTGSGSGFGVGTGTTAALEEECPCCECEAIANKYFDFPVIEKPGTPVGVERPHLVTDTPQDDKYEIARIGADVDPEWNTGDMGDSGDQDGWILDGGLGDIYSNKRLIVMDIWHHQINDADATFQPIYYTNPPFTAHNNFGTIIIYRYEKRSESFWEFEVVEVVAVRQVGRVEIEIQEKWLEEEGFIGSIYVDADAINYGFDLDDIRGRAYTVAAPFPSVVPRAHAQASGWRGTHLQLMNLFGIQQTHPYSLDTPKGEIEEYWYCNKDLDGDGERDFKYYRPEEEAAFRIHCPLEREEEIIEITNTPGTSGTNITVYCGDTNVICNAGGNLSNTAGNFSNTPTTTTSTTDNRTIAEIMADLLNTFLTNPNNTDPQTRLEFWFQAFVVWTAALGSI